MYTPLAIIFVLSQVSHGHWHSSVGQMEDLMHEELSLVKNIEEYIASREKKLAMVKFVVDRLNAEAEGAAVDVEKYLGHPVNQYLLLKRLIMGFELIEDLIDRNRTFADHLSTIRSNIPDKEDIKESATALRRLQVTYKLDIQQLAKGIVKDADKSLSADDCYQIGEAAYLDKDFYGCASWMEEAYNRVWEGDTSRGWFEVSDYLAYAQSELGNFERAFSLTRELLTAEPDNARLLANFALLSQQVDDLTKDGIQEGAVMGPEDKTERQALYERLCRDGGDPVPSDVTKNLKCYLWHNNHPFMRVQPIKMEELWKSPSIVRFYDIISDKESDIIKKLAKPKLKRATILNEELGEGGKKPAKHRVGKTAWLTDRKHHVVQRLSKRMSAITGLGLKTAEPLQLSNYGIGGHFLPHVDYLRAHEQTDIERDNGPRIATILLYLTNVKYGGATVFLPQKLYVEPIEGSAIFWFNILTSGECDERTRHAACPVLNGIKWVANKWIHSNEQMFTNPCKLDESADYTFS
ncbi:prolyl 4-hydroxylase subunit alpha-2-like [Styela clava]